jgi:hypothetical protein
MGAGGYLKRKGKTFKGTSRQFGRFHAQIIGQSVKWFHEYRKQNKLFSKLQDLTQAICRILPFVIILIFVHLI